MPNFGITTSTAISLSPFFSVGK
ncbi:hypothetical protein CGLO_12795 [Colletotrichum gloeosporioides Cg-14]|uniref:Uncharacterized protein n=1 Tax=Colletotrichum gloeosporioides (strain Cg-14) TaxID=1237896 RepID=T0K4W4_COLGC|nr:hypothetical protein CGLO_12795 [Colletotrichum gloeosporioides Cg-14]